MSKDTEKKSTECSSQTSVGCSSELFVTQAKQLDLDVKSELAMADPVSEDTPGVIPEILITNSILKCPDCGWDLLKGLICINCCSPG